MDRLAGDNLVPVIARPQDKQGKDWRLRHESETKRAVRQVYISREELHPCMGNISRDSIALDRNNFPLPQRIKQIKRESGAACAVTDLHSAGSRLLHGNIDVLRGLLIQFRRAHHPDLAMKPLGEDRSAQIVISHMRGENNRAMGRRQLIEILFALQLVSELGFGEFVIGDIRNRPGKVKKRQPRSGVVGRRPGAWPHHLKIRDDGAASRRSKEEEEIRPEEKQDGLEIERHVYHCPIQVLSPKNAAHSKAAQPAV